MNDVMDVRKVKMLGYGLSASFLMIHVAMLLFFSHFGVTPMARFNMFSIAFYLVSFLMLRYDCMWLYAVTVYLEVALHMTLAVVFVGVDAGFQVTLIGMNALGFYSEYLSGHLKSRRISGAALCLIGMVMYLFCFIYTRSHPAPYVLPPDVCFWMQIAWGIIIFAVNIFFLKVFVMISLRSERILEEAGTQANSMVTALSSDYRSVYYVDLDRDKGICYREDPSDDEQSPEGIPFPYRERFTWYAENHVAENYLEGFMNFIDPENIRRRLESEPIIAYRYLARRNGREYYEMIRMAGVRRAEDRDDHLVHAIGLGITIIDEEMRETLAKNEALADALEVAEEANRAKTAFLSSMSHEIRTPMNAIIGLNRMALRDEDLSSDTREHLGKIDESAQHLLGIINDVLDMSRIESGHMTLKSEEFSFPVMIDQINTMIGPQCKDKGLDYECRIIGEVDEKYIGDDTKLREVLINILSNAVKFTEAPGSVTMTVERTAAYGDKSTLRFSIKDSGIGMDPEYIPKIFEAFSQEDSSRKNKYGSTGLGMAITKGIVDMMNGTIEVESEKGKGTEFIVTVTLRKGMAAAANEAEDAASKESPAASFEGLRVLLAEDVEINAEIMMDILSLEDIEAEHAENGRIAVEMFAGSEPGHYDAILMDVRMPEMDGLEAASAIRAMDREDAKHIPIIALTANAFDEDVQRSLQAGMNAHLSKPVDPDKLFASMRRLVDRGSDRPSDHVKEQ